MEHTPMAHGHTCGCGCEHNHGEQIRHSHHHEHSEGCGCGHDHSEQSHHNHHHEHSEGCGCASHYQGDITGLSEAQADMLRLIEQYSCLPVVRFELRSSKDDSLHMTAMEPVAINQENDSADLIRKRGEVLLSLADMGLITLDYDIPIKGYDYAGYHNSSLFIQLKQAAAEAAKNPTFLFDQAVLQGGSMALTDMGAMILD